MAAIRCEGDLERLIGLLHDNLRDYDRRPSHALQLECVGLLDRLGAMREAEAAEKQERPLLLPSRYVDRRSETAPLTLKETDLVDVPQHIRDQFLQVRDELRRQESNLSALKRNRMSHGSLRPVAERVKTLREELIPLEIHVRQIVEGELDVESTYVPF
jgi:hypothetical protein